MFLFSCLPKTQVYPKHAGYSKHLQQHFIIADQMFTRFIVGSVTSMNSGHHACLDVWCNLCSKDLQRASICSLSICIYTPVLLQSATLQSCCSSIYFIVAAICIHSSITKVAHSPVLLQSIYTAAVVFGALILFVVVLISHPAIYFYVSLI